MRLSRPINRLQSLRRRSQRRTQPQRLQPRRLHQLPSRCLRWWKTTLFPMILEETTVILTSMKMTPSTQVEL
ncbi:Hypothetical predicted protein [Scomber scombrus]|uniref:Uncharacterized protein n=1 Tax=Scomber scombrus TaxID=13677 RepID=A0AAV1Q798_SCOSC